MLVTSTRANSLRGRVLYSGCQSTFNLAMSDSNSPPRGSLRPSRYGSEVIAGK